MTAFFALILSKRIVQINFSYFVQTARSQRQIDINPAEFSKYKLEKPGNN